MQFSFVNEFTKLFHILLKETNINRTYMILSNVICSSEFRKSDMGIQIFGPVFEIM
jgi:hypothetical protein